jgi:hypothetical protein
MNIIPKYLNFATFSNNALAIFLFWFCPKFSKVNFYEGRLQSSWTHLITTSRNFVEVRWRSLFQSTSFGRRYISYNAPPTSRKHAADRWPLRNFLPWSSLFMVGNAQKSHEARSELNSVFGLGTVHRWNPIRISTILSAPWSFLFR